MIDLINDSITRINKHADKIQNRLSIPFTPRQLQIKHIDELAQLGINWIAPLDARNTGLPTASIDFMSNTATLEHIPADDILLILKECYRLLKPGALLSCVIDFADHYSYFDKNINPYNFLTLSDTAWALLNSPIHYQNRLRYSDYMALLAQTPLKIVTQEIFRPATFDAISSLKLAPRFEKYELDDLAIVGMRLLLQRS